MNKQRMKIGRVKEPFVSVIVFNYNGRGFLKSCLTSVLKQTYKNYEVVLFDNGSTDDSVGYVKRMFRSVKIIHIEPNAGIAAAQNRGYKSLKGDYIASLHNDAIADKNWLRELVNSLKNADMNVACVEGGVHHFGNVGVLNGSLNIASYNMFDVFKDQKKKFYAGTCSMILKNGIMNEYCDEDYFFYGEDVYLGWLLRLKGYNIIREPKSKVLHHGTVSASSMGIKKLYQFYSERNRALNFLIFFERKNMIKLLPIYFFTVLYMVLSASFKNKWKIKPYVKSYIWILTHFQDILKKRIFVQRQRKIPDNIITRMLSSRIVTESMPYSKYINNLSMFYCKFVGIDTVESTKNF